ncbi:MAG: DUF2520 domain-containing protein [Actinomycetota bacterium]|nr:DUF2520 domain-containing protein [Actinomycetota bacterium]
MTSVRIIGGGRAGRSFETALGEAGLEVAGVLHRDDDFSGAAEGVDVLLVAVPDRFVAAIARAVAPQGSTAVVHCSGSLGLDVLSGHERPASLHPLVTLPDPVIGALRLRGGAFFAVAGDQVATDIALALAGHPIVVAEADRPAYHAAACIAANHLVALMGQVQRVAGTVGLPLDAFLPLARGALDDVALLGPAGALTGPAARGDEATLDRHRAALAPEERDGYDAAVGLARRLAGAGAPTWR